VSREGGSIAHHQLQKIGQLSAATITTTSVAREKLKMLMSKTHARTHTHNSDTQTSETPQENMHLRPLELF
jgi:hypothetical protein